MKAPSIEKNANRKRSVMVSKRRTSISLEDSFWNSLHAIVQMENLTVADFVEKIARQHSTPNLSSNLRVAVLEYYQQMATNRIAVRGDISLVPPAGRIEDPSPAVRNQTSNE